MFCFHQYKLAYAPRPAGLGWVQGTPAQIFKILGFQKGILFIFGITRGESIINIEVYYINSCGNQIM